MKVTKRQLRQIIKEEKARILKEQADPMELEFAKNDLKAMQGIIQEFQTGMKMSMDPDRITGVVDAQLVADIKTIMEMAEALRQKIYDQR
tara:strand:+ start:1081 stop:1350 length:270 start_codon:yes stop_codon:yes gene_type:complete